LNLVFSVSGEIGVLVVELFGKVAFVELPMLGDKIGAVAVELFESAKPFARGAIAENTEKTMQASAIAANVFFILFFISFFTVLFLSLSWD
jgi:hypothetical protein